MKRYVLSLLVVFACFTPVAIAAPPEAVKASAEVLPVPGLDQAWTAIESLEQRVDRLEKQAAPVAKVAAPVVAKPVQVVQSCPTGQCPTASVQRSRTVVSSSYSPRWQNHDGQSLRDHAVREHGFDPNLSDAQLFAQHDAYHDQYGGAPPAMRSRSAAVQPSSNCPGGVCPTSRSTSVQSSGGLLGFGIFGRRR